MWFSCSLDVSEVNLHPKYESTWNQQTNDSLSRRRKNKRLWDGEKNGREIWPLAIGSPTPWLHLLPPGPPPVYSKPLCSSAQLKHVHIFFEGWLNLSITGANEPPPPANDAALDQRESLLLLLEGQLTNQEQLRLRGRRRRGERGDCRGRQPAWTLVAEPKAR